MCFSAPASFVAGALLSGIGITSQRKVRKPEQRLFAVIPFLFGLQQFAEGVLWITLRSGGGYDWLQNVATYAFLIPALVIWPTMVPLSIWFMEKAETRKKILAGLMATGGIVSLFYVFCLISYNVTPQILGFHMVYLDEFPRTIMDIAFPFYLASTIAPLFVSTIRRMRVFGILIAISYLVTGIFFKHYLTSVWCFFAALISVVIYWILSESHTTVPSEAWEQAKNS
jgi:hypothetical protein